MIKIGVFFGSYTGNVEKAAEKIVELLGDADIINVNNASIKDMKQYDILFLGTSTWGDGELQDDWAGIADDIPSLDLSGKKVALFSMGDQEGHGDTFVNAMGIMYKLIGQTGATIIGSTSTDGYEYSGSSAVVDGKFVGLALDEDNQFELTDKRLEDWITQLKPELS